MSGTRSGGLSRDWTWVDKLKTSIIGMLNVYQKIRNQSEDIKAILNWLTAHSRDRPARFGPSELGPSAELAPEECSFYIENAWNQKKSLATKITTEIVIPRNNRLSVFTILSTIKQFILFVIKSSHLKRQNSSINDFYK